MRYISVVTLAAFFVILACSEAVLSNEPDEGKAAQKETTPYSMGRPAPSNWQNAIFNATADLVRPYAQDIALFVNDKGCVLDRSGVAKKIDAGYVNNIINSALRRTEILYLYKSEMIRLTGTESARAASITSELKETFHDENDFKIGNMIKNAIIFVGNPPRAGQPPDTGNVSEQRHGHEFLHIVLRQFNNRSLGGGDRKSDPDREIAAVHHELTCYLGWSPQQCAIQWNPDEASCACCVPTPDEDAEKDEKTMVDDD
mgnify:FL=1